MKFKFFGFSCYLKIKKQIPNTYYKLINKKKVFLKMYLL